MIHVYQLLKFENKNTLKLESQPLNPAVEDVYCLQHTFIVFRIEVCKSWNSTVKIALPLSSNTLPKLQRSIYFEILPLVLLDGTASILLLPENVDIFFLFFSFLCLQTLLVKHHTEKYGVLSFIVV